jgi:hypothetical protein
MFFKHLKFASKRSTAILFAAAILIAPTVV